MNTPKNPLLYFLVLNFVLLFSLTNNINAGEAQKVGGVYKVESIEKLSDRNFQIKFLAENKTGRFDELTLHSDHVHVAVNRGDIIRVSALILSEQGAKAEVSQLVVFLPSRNGSVPVWLLSNKTTHDELKASKYLEMHTPLNDFFVL